MNYYCSNCKISFDEDESNKAHYKTDFHRYNIKRKLINLEPVTSEAY